MALLNAQYPLRFVSNYPNFEKYTLLPIHHRMHVTTSATGRGVTMAYLDAGFYMHPDIRDRVRLHVDATTDNIHEEKEITHTDVTSWHGLMVSAIGSGNGRVSNGLYRGLASDSEMILIKVSNPRLQVKEADILRGFRWLIDNHAQYNIRVVNVSVGGDRYSEDPDHPLHAAIRELSEAGVAVVISSGNHGRDSLVPPASAPEAIVVGGYNDNNHTDPVCWRAYHSNYGQAHDGTPKPDVIAPAEWLPSPILPETFVAREARWLGDLIGSSSHTQLMQALKKGYRDLNLPASCTKDVDTDLINDLQNRIYAHKLISKSHQYVDGTSVAAPIVSATIALMLEANPSLSVAQIRTILQETAEPVSSIPPHHQGAGAVQVDAAVARARSI